MIEIKKLKNRKAYLEKTIKSNYEKIKRLPDGTLFLRSEENSYKWFHLSGSERKYIKKSNRELAEKLAVKRMLQLWNADAEAELAAINAYLENIEDKTGKMEEYLRSSEEIGQLVAPYYKSKNKKVLDWQATPHDTNPMPIENGFRTERGEQVRSKSEMIFADWYYRNNIPYKYECRHALKVPVNVNGRIEMQNMVVYDDFTILDTNTMTEIVHEHLGKMDDPEYADRAGRKVAAYLASGYVPGRNLIITSETGEYPIDMAGAKELIANVLGIGTAESNL